MGHGRGDDLREVGMELLSNRIFRFPSRRSLMITRPKDETYFTLLCFALCHTYAMMKLFRHKDLR